MRAATCQPIRATLPNAMSLLLLLAMAACHGGPPTMTFDGADTLTFDTAPRVATVRVAGDISSDQDIELRTDTNPPVVFTGKLVRNGPNPPISPGGQIPLGDSDPAQLLVANLSATNQLPLNCRFQVLNPVRGLAGGGFGVCSDDAGRRIDFSY